MKDQPTFKVGERVWVCDKQRAPEHMWTEHTVTAIKIKQRTSKQWFITLDNGTRYTWCMGEWELRPARTYLGDCVLVKQDTAGYRAHAEWQAWVVQRQAQLAEHAEREAKRVHVSG